jgi:hypothetical protein
MDRWNRWNLFCISAHTGGSISSDTQKKLGGSLGVKCGKGSTCSTYPPLPHEAVGTTYAGGHLGTDGRRRFLARAVAWRPRGGG